LPKIKLIVCGLCVSSVERGKRNLSLHNIAKLAYALGIPVSSLMGCLDP
jgi:transcriptional regulator with XRE-family HTH domain